MLTNAQVLMVYSLVEQGSSGLAARSQRQLPADQEVGRLGSQEQ